MSTDKPTALPAWATHGMTMAPAKGLGAQARDKCLDYAIAACPRDMSYDLREVIVDGEPCWQWFAPATPPGPAGADQRSFFEAGTDDLGLQVVAIDGNDRVNFSCNNDWCGDTQSGIGATVSVDITREDAQRLVAMLSKWLAT